MNLVYDIDVEETEMQISSFKDSNADLIERNRKKWANRFFSRFFV